jgi:hypothetical protein
MCHRDASTYTNLLRATSCLGSEGEDICFGTSGDTAVVGALKAVIETYFCSCC